VIPARSRRPAPDTATTSRLDRGSSAERRWMRMEYESPEILASYSEEELTAEAAACQV
jgi:hypothetical protein